MSSFRHLDLFSGIGGFALAGSAVWGTDYEIVAFCEKDIFCRNLLNKHWPKVPVIDDIKELGGTTYGQLDLITGGFPCQPFSSTGKRKGQSDDRYLWPEMFRIIKNERPRWIIGENVIGIIPMALDQVLFDLESIGYDAWPIVIPACSVGARHIRRRVWILANSDAQGIFKHVGQRRAISGWAQKKDFGSNDRLEDFVLSGDVAPSEWEIAGQSACPRPLLVRKSDGVPNELDRISALGNAIFPGVAETIMSAIKYIDNLL